MTYGFHIEKKIPMLVALKNGYCPTNLHRRIHEIIAIKKNKKFNVNNHFYTLLVDCMYMEENNSLLIKVDG